MQQPKKLNLTLAVLATGVMSFSGVLIETAMNVTFPTLMKQFSISTATVQWVTTIYLLVISIFVPLSTYLTKNYSTKNLFLTANFLFLLGVVVDFFSPTFMILLLGRLLQGVATGIALPLMFNIILTEAPMSKRGVMMGIGTLTTSLAPAIGPTYGGILTTTISWHYIFLFLIPLLILSMGLGWYAIPQRKVTKTSKLDFASMLYLALTFSGLLLFLSVAGTLKGWLYLAVGVAGITAFLITSTRKQDPLINIRILKNKPFVLLLFGFLVYQILLLGISFVVPNYVQIVNGKSASIAGLVMLPGATVGALFAPISGKLLDHFGAKKPILFGVGAATVGWALLTFLINDISLAMIIVCHVLFSVGVGFSYSNLMTTGMNELPKELQGDGNAIFNTLQQFMGAFATSLVATIISVTQEKSGLAYIDATIFGSKISLIVLLVLLILSLLGCLSYFQTKKNLLATK